MAKEAIVYIYVTQAYNGVLLTNKNEWYFAICSNTDGLGGHYARDKSENDKYCMIGSRMYCTTQGM